MKITTTALLVSVLAGAATMSFSSKAASTPADGFDDA
jgi:hypothetical protein